MKGIFPASFLGAIEEALGFDSVARYFDLIVGTSTGGILALGLALGKSARQLADFYLEEGPKIFPAKAVPRKVDILFSRFQYDPAPLRKALERVFEQKRLSDATVRLLIPSFDA